jgi:hypothetical protein
MVLTSSNYNLTQQFEGENRSNLAVISQNSPNSMQFLNRWGYPFTWRVAEGGNLTPQIEIMNITSLGNLTIIGNFTTHQTGFFDGLGTMTKRITTLFAQNIDVNNSINVTKNITAEYILSDGRYLTGIKKEIFYPAETSANLGNFRVRTIAGGGNFNFNFYIPVDLFVLESAAAVGIVSGAGATGTGKDIDIKINCGSSSDAYNNYSQSYTNSTYTIPTINILWELDLTNILSNLTAGDYCGLNIGHNGIGGSIGYIGIKLEYR